MKRIRNLYERVRPFIDKVNEDNIFAIAGQSAFFMLLSVIPLSMFAISVIQSFNLPFDKMNETLSEVFSVTVVNYVAELLHDALNTSASVSIVTLLITLWSAAQGIHAITNGLNRIFGTYENRNWFVLRFRAMLYTIVFVVILFVSLLIIVLGSTINSWLAPYLSNMPKFVAVLYYLRYILVFMYLAVLFTLIYRNFPNISREKRKEYGFKYHLPGALLCALAWFGLSFGISIYVDDFNGFSIYGGLTRLAVIMVWLYFCMVSLMLCAEINNFYHEKFKKLMLTVKTKR